MQSNKRLAAAVSATVDGDRESERILIPGLPNHISHLCISKLSPSLVFHVSSAWRRLLYSPLFPPFLSLYAIFSPTATAGCLPIRFMSYDPLSAEWVPVPAPPDEPLDILLCHPSFISRRLPIQSLSVSGRLIILAGTNYRLLPALEHPLIFSPNTSSWSHGPALSVPRRWCAAGAIGRSVYVASGIGSHFNTDVARSFDKWDIDGENWDSMGQLKDVRFSREAIDAVGCKGKLWMVNVKGDAAKQGAVYDADGDRTWEEMPEEMIGGWRGPGTAMEEEELYVVDESKGSLRKWDWVDTRWLEVVESPLLRGAQQISAGGGKVCVVVDGGGGIVVVDVVAEPGRVWVVDTLPGLEVVAVHILPRMSTK